MYSTELKLEIVQRYLQGTSGIKTLAKEYHVDCGDIHKWKDSIRKWEQVYYEYGREALYEEHRGRTSKMGIKKERKQKKYRTERRPPGRSPASSRGE